MFAFDQRLFIGLSLAFRQSVFTRMAVVKALEKILDSKFLRFVLRLDLRTVTETVVTCLSESGHNMGVHIH